MDPLKTRSLPHGVWRHVPEPVVQWDVSVQQSLEASREHMKWFWDVFNYLSAHPNGILLTVLGFWVFWVWQRIRRQGLRWWAILRFDALFAVSLAPLLGISDLLSTMLKVYFGRLKPHVTFYNPRVLPALSFPSNHAVNTAFVFVLLALSLNLSGRQKTVFLSVGGGIVFFVGFSRIVLGEHHPLDVLAGWLIGAVLAFLLQGVYRRILCRIRP